MKSKPIFYQITFFIFLFLINSSFSKVVIKAGNVINYFCEKNIYYIKIEVTFSEKPKNELYFFTLTLSYPDNLDFKCALDYYKSQIYCFKSITDNSDLIPKNTFFQLPYPFPEIKSIYCDYESFMEKIYNKVWRTVENCGNEDIFLNTTSNPSDKIFDLEGKIFFINNAQCKV